MHTCSSDWKRVIVIFIMIWTTVHVTWANAGQYTWQPLHVEVTDLMLWRLPDAILSRRQIVNKVCYICDQHYIPEPSHVIHFMKHYLSGKSVYGIAVLGAECCPHRLLETNEWIMCTLVVALDLCAQV